MHDSQPGVDEETVELVSVTGPSGSANDSTTTAEAAPHLVFEIPMAAY